MACEVTMADQTVERIDGADGYELEGPLTTFFSSEGRHQKLTSWSVRQASYRTERIACIRRVEDRAADTGYSPRLETVPFAS